MQRNPIRLPIGEYLYKLKFAFDSKKESLAARDTKIKKEQAGCNYVGPTSQKLLGRLEKRGFKKIFEYLDKDKVFYHLLGLLSITHSYTEEIFISNNIKRYLFYFIKIFIFFVS